MARRPLVVGNWKMNGTLESARQLARDIAAGAGGVTAVGIVICPPHPLLGTVATEVDGSSVSLGAQTVSEFAQGAYTGETSASMLREIGCEFVIVGHSERRQLFGESSAAVAAKAQAAGAAGMVPIICVGEVLEDRQRGATIEVVTAQLGPFVANGALPSGAVIAYEPVWAIGTGETATPEQAQDVHAAIRGVLATIDPAVADATRILYGGSVKPDNARELFLMADVDGGLIGGASLKADEFLSICGATA